MVIGPLVSHSPSGIPAELHYKRNPDWSNARGYCMDLLTPDEIAAKYGGWEITYIKGLTLVKRSFKLRASV